MSDAASPAAEDETPKKEPKTRHSEAKPKAPAGDEVEKKTVDPLVDDDPSDDGLPIEVDRVIEAVIDDLPADKQDDARLLLSVTMERSYRGPIPPPEMMAKYAEVDPDAPRIILDQFQKQGDHRRVMESTFMAGSERRANVGQILGTILVGIAIVGGIACILVGQAGAGIAIVVAALGTGVLSFVFASKPARSSRPKG